MMEVGVMESKFEPTKLKEAGLYLQISLDIIKKRERNVSLFLKVINFIKSLGG
jgi:hypothetical protein